VRAERKSGCLNMKKLSNSLRKHQVLGLPIFDWRAVVVHRPVTAGGLFLRNRFRVRPEIADVVARLAGLGREVEQ